MSPDDKLTVAQSALYDLMARISEELHCAGWMSGNEFMLWRAVLNGDDEIDADDLAELRRRADEIGGWIVWRDDGDDADLPLEEWGPYFVPMAEWLEMYRRSRWARS